MPTFVTEEVLETGKRYTASPELKDIGNYQLVIAYNSVPTITKSLKVATCSPILAPDT